MTSLFEHKIRAICIKQYTNYNGDIWFDNDPEIESKYHHYNLCLVTSNNSYLELTKC